MPPLTPTEKLAQYEALLEQFVLKMDKTKDHDIDKAIDLLVRLMDRLSHSRFFKH